MQRIGIRTLIAVWLALAFSACAPEPPPRTVREFLEDPIALDATLSRCNVERYRTRDDPECRNAREAAKRISQGEEEERMRRLEAESQRKLEEARRRQRERDAARAAAEERARLAEEARILEQLREGASGQPPAEYESPESRSADGVAPSLPAAGQAGTVEQTPDDRPVEEAEDRPPVSDLEALREELNRRSGGASDSGQEEGG